MFLESIRFDLCLTHICIFYNPLPHTPNSFRVAFHFSISSSLRLLPQARAGRARRVARLWRSHTQTVCDCRSRTQSAQTRAGRRLSDSRLGRYADRALTALVIYLAMHLSAPLSLFFCFHGARRGASTLIRSFSQISQRIVFFAACSNFTCPRVLAFCRVPHPPRRVGRDELARGGRHHARLGFD